MPRVLYGREDLRNRYPYASLAGFNPVFRVEVHDLRARKVLREDFIELREEDGGIRFGYTPEDPEPLYAFIHPSRWQSLETHGVVKAHPIRYEPDYVPPSQRGGVVYFIQSGEKGPIKIGWSEDVARRLAELQTANAHPLRVLGTTPGTLEDELSMHTRFAHLRMEAEWFRCDPEILEFVSRLQDLEV